MRARILTEHVHERTHPELRAFRRPPRAKGYQHVTNSCQHASLFGGETMHRNALRAAVLAALALGCAAQLDAVPAGRPRAQRGAATTAAASHLARRQARPLDVAGCTLASVVRSRTTSRECLGCHDGSVAAPRVELPGCHPVDVGYEAARLAGRGALRPVVETPDALVLFAGTTVTCTTCHDGASPWPSHVAVTLERSGLCLGCHARGSFD
jgi:predicted CXXCH cytochrome family protein